jgi:4a-hydroxytetrahydrobiopterin dehydratase
VKQCHAWRNQATRRFPYAMGMARLSTDQIQAQLPDGWSGSDSGITRSFSFSSYEAGVAFAVQVALLAQRADHHPDALSIGWKTVTVTYVTHSAGGVTDLDLNAAQSVNAAFAG